LHEVAKLQRFFQFALTIALLHENDAKTFRSSLDNTHCDAVIQSQTKALEVKATTPHKSS
ncbi:MAG: hypothetical protein ACLRV7_05540, partial [Hoylesella buccalis]